MGKRRIIQAFCGETTSCLKNVLERMEYYIKFEHSLLRCNEHDLLRRVNIVVIDSTIEKDFSKTINAIKRITDGERIIRPGIIVLTPQSHEDDQIQAYGAGADCCIDDSSQSVIAYRIRSLDKLLIRLSQGNKIRWNDLVITPEKFEIRKNGQRIELTKIQHQLLMLLVQNKRAVSREEIIEKVFFKKEVGMRTVDRNIFRLREALGDTKLPFKYIISCHGMGYSMKWL